MLINKTLRDGAKNAPPQGERCSFPCYNRCASMMTFTAGENIMNLKKIFLILISLFFTSLSYAQNISLYDQPNGNAKVIGKIDTASGIIPIFKPQTGDWVKVADPRNGNVGWIKQSDFNNANVSRSSYQVIQYGSQQDNQRKLSDTEMQDIINKARERANTYNKNLPNNLQNMMDNMNQVIQKEVERVRKTGDTGPIILPVIIMPGQTMPANQQKPTVDTKPNVDSKTAPASVTPEMKKD